MRVASAGILAFAFVAVTISAAPAGIPSRSIDHKNPSGGVSHSQNPHHTKPEEKKHHNKNKEGGKSGSHH
ncbi:hypothetical protein EV178_004588 [Coemansia sp. RSA 1646]|nr:hypothetical protein EV178_004588 [Coemansia sp. RSA 1646]